MKVGFEMIAAGSLLGEGQGGATGYYDGILPPLLDDPRIERLLVYAPRSYERAAQWRHPKLELRRCAVPAARPRRVAYEQAALPRMARRDGVDVLFSTANVRPVAYRRPNVVGLHAIQHFLLGDDIGRVRSAYVRFAVPRSLRSADRAIAVSETLRRDAIGLFDLDPDRVVAVPLGPSPWALEAAAAPPPEPYRTAGGSPYVLSISRLYALKNHRRLIEGFARAVGRNGLPHALVVAGGDADVTRGELAEHARALGVADRVHLLGRVPQALVPALYAGADAVAYVSLYETFGHPVLETFATRRPLLTSAAGGTAEVAGQAARLVDPRDPDDIAAGLADVLTDAALRERLVAAGTRRLGDFSWERCARGTVDALAAARGY